MMSDLLGVAVLCLTVSGSIARYCELHETPAVQMCQSGTVSGNQVHIDTQGVPDNMAAREECTCDVDLEGGTVDYLQYSGPGGGTNCGYSFNYGNSRASCSSFTHFEVGVFTSVILEVLIAAVDPFNCLSLYMEGNANATITCHEYKKTTSTVSTTTMTTAVSTSSTSTTTTSSTTRTVTETTTTMSITTPATSTTTTETSRSTTASVASTPASHQAVLSTTANRGTTGKTDPAVCDCTYSDKDCSPVSAGVYVGCVLAGVVLGGIVSPLLIFLVRKLTVSKPPVYETPMARQNNVQLYDVVDTNQTAVDHRDPGYENHAIATAGGDQDGQSHMYTNVP